MVLYIVTILLNTLYEGSIVMDYPDILILFLLILIIETYFVDRCILLFLTQIQIQILEIISALLSIYCRYKFALFLQITLDAIFEF